jgi:hypothetical protein
MAAENRSCGYGVASMASGGWLNVSNGGGNGVAAHQMHRSGSSEAAA